MICLSRKKLPDVFLRELQHVQEYNVAERIDDTPTLLLDVLFAYRLLLGRWPEFDTVSQYQARLGDQDLFTFVMSFIKSPEFQVRLPDLPGLDLVVMAELPEGPRLFFNLRDRQALRIVTGIHELDIQKAMRRVLRPGLNCADIGAHIGLYSLLMASVVGQGGGKVYAFECLAGTYDLLSKNVKENGFEDIIFSYQVACHYKSGHGQAFIPQSDDLGSIFVPKRQKAKITAGLVGLDTELAPVDHLIPPQVRVGLVKMDIEGSEPFALRGMERIVTRDRPVIFTEFNPYCLRNMNESDPADYLRQLRNYEYKLLEVQSFLQKIDHEYQYTAGDVTTNLVCVPKEVPVSRLFV